MKRRPAVTLMEVLVAMFIMAIGMMALLVLFPVGAVSMAQALKDDRCAYASTVSENVAIANDVRHDPVVTGSIISPTGFASPLALTSGLVYVDPYPFTSGATLVQPTLATLGGIIPRVAPSFALTPALADRWFSLQDDIGFAQSGLPDTSNTGGVIDRGRGYTYAYLLRRMPPLLQQLGTNPFATSGYAVQLFAVVYKSRPIASLTTTTTEWPYVATVTATQPPPLPAPSLIPPPTTNGLQIVGATTAKRGGWILDVSPKNSLLTPRYPWEYPNSGNFYRITNVVQSGGLTVLETQQNLKLSQENYLAGQYNMNILIMDNVAEVFDKGFGWKQ